MTSDHRIRNTRITQAVAVVGIVAVVVLLGMLFLTATAPWTTTERFSSGHGIEGVTTEADAPTVANGDPSVYVLLEENHAITELYLLDGKHGRVIDSASVPPVAGVVPIEIVPDAGVYVVVGVDATGTEVAVYGFGYGSEWPAWVPDPFDQHIENYEKTLPVA